MMMMMIIMIIMIIIIIIITIIIEIEPSQNHSGNTGEPYLKSKNSSKYRKQPYWAQHTSFGNC